MAHPWFLLGLALLLVHELDAMRCHEWRIFPGLSLLPDKTGRMVFILLHIPLFFALLAGITRVGDEQGLITGLDIFLIVHLVLHLLFLLHPKNEFNDAWSWGIIAGTAACGGFDLLLLI